MLLHILHAGVAGECHSWWCERGDSNPHDQWSLGPKPSASANSATLA